MDPETLSFTQGNDAARPIVNRHRYNPPAYTSVDPFIPSIAFSLRNLATRSSEEDVNVLEDDRPPLRATRPQRLPPGSPSRHPKTPTGYFAGPQGQGQGRRDNSTGYHLPPTNVPAVAMPPSAVPDNLPVRPAPIYAHRKAPPRPTSMDRYSHWHAWSGLNEGSSHTIYEHGKSGGQPGPQETAHRPVEYQHPSSVVYEGVPTILHDRLSGTPCPVPEAWPISPPACPPCPPSTGSHPNSPQPRLSMHSTRNSVTDLNALQASPRVNSDITVSISVVNMDRLSEKGSTSRKGIQRYLKFKLPANSYAVAFLVDTLPRQIYLNLLLRLPYLYFSRVTRIFEEAEMSMPMIRKGILDAARANLEAKGQNNNLGQPLLGRGWGAELEPAKDNAAYNNLQATWLAFIDALLKEWKTLNIISVLLLSAILTILQIESAASDPLTRYSALLSMICALMSLVYGCIYIIQFATMKKTYKGAVWAQEAQKSKSKIWWNIWVMLAMPATWLAWSVILYIMTITAFVWRTSPFQNQTFSDFILSTSSQILVPRIIITTVLSLGIVYFVLIAFTLRRYGDTMDRAWQKRILGWMECADEPENIDVETNKHPIPSWNTWQPDRWQGDFKEEEENHANQQNRCNEIIQRQMYSQASQATVLSTTGQRNAGQVPDKSLPETLITPPAKTSMILDPVENISLSPLYEFQNVLRMLSETDFVALGQNQDRLLGSVPPAETGPDRITPLDELHPGAMLTLTPNAAPPTALRCDDGSSRSTCVKLLQLPLSADYVDIIPSNDDLQKCGLSLDAFSFQCSEGNGWEKFKAHIHSVFGDPIQDPHDSPPPNAVPNALWFVLELWNAKLQFNGVTGFLASCESSPGDHTLAIYYFHESHPVSPSTPLHVTR